MRRSSPGLPVELHNELLDIKGFSERNIDRMIAFFRAYPEPSDFSPPAVAKLSMPSKVPQPVANLPAQIMQEPLAQSIDSLIWRIPWAHHVIIMEKIKGMEMLRDEICRSAPYFSSPSWHENGLKEREQRMRDGRDKFVVCDQAKKDILKPSTELV